MKIQNQLGYIKGITFAPFHRRGSLSTQTARDSFDYMIEHTAADFVILAPAGLQEHAHSEEICYTSSATFSDEQYDTLCKKQGHPCCPETYRQL